MLRNFSLKIDIEWVFAFVMATGFAYFVGTGFWLGAAGIMAIMVSIWLGLTQQYMLTVVWLVGMPTIFVMANNVMSSIPILNADRALFFVLLGFLIAHALVRSNMVAGGGTLGAALGIYLFYVLVSWSFTLPDRAWSDVYRDIAFLLDRFLMPTVAYLMARFLPWERERLTTFLWIVVAWMGSYLIITGLLQYALGWTFFMPAGPERLFPDRVTGPFVNSTYYGMAVAMVMLMALFLALHTKALGWRSVLLAFVGALLLMVLLSKSRSVWLAAPIVLAYLFLRVQRTRPMITFAAVAVAAVAPVALPLIVDFGDLATRLGSLGPIYNRLTLWGTAVNMIIDKPIFGFGFGWATFGQYKADFYASVAGVPAQYAAIPKIPHNEYLNVGVMLGLVGLVLYFVCLSRAWRVLTAVRQSWAHEDSFVSDLAVFVQSCLLLVLVGVVFIDLAESSSVIVIFLFFLIGIVTRFHDIVKPTTAPAPEPSRARSLILRTPATATPRTAKGTPTRPALSRARPRG